MPVERRDCPGRQVRERVVVGRLGDLDLLPRRLAVDGRAGTGGEHGLATVRERIADLHAGRLSVDIRERARVAVAEPRLVVVVHRECSAGLEQLLHAFHRLLGEEVVLEPQHALPCEERERVGQREDDQVVAVVCVLHVGAAIVDVFRHARVLPRMIRVVLTAEPLDLRVDLDCVDVLRAFRERDRDVVAVTGADDQDVVELLRVTVREEVETLDLAQRLDAVRRLVRHVVRGNREHAVRADPRDARLVLIRRADLVVGRPMVA